MIGNWIKRGAIGLALVAIGLLSSSPTALAAWSIEEFDGGVPDAGGEPTTQAGGHPFKATTTFTFSTEVHSSGEYEFSTEDLRDAFVDLPPGFIGNPEVVGKCSEDQLQELGKASEGLTEEAVGVPLCPLDSQVGTITLLKNGTEGLGVGQPNPLTYPVYALETPAGVPALFGFNIGSALFHVSASLRTGGDYGITAGTANASSTLQLGGVTFDFWGVPADPVWDPIRGGCAKTSGGGPEENAVGCPATVDREPKAFFTLPTSCLGPQRTFLHTTTWPGSSASSSFLSHDNATPVPNPIGNDGCEDVPFDPSFSAQPETGNAEEATGLDFTLVVPQDGLEDPDGIATANLRKAVVTLPPGMTVNPSSADGLAACTPQQIALSSPAADRCPPASKVGEVEIVTPLLDHVVPGGVYLASQSSFEDSLISLYIAVDDPASGVVVKLGGTVSPDPRTGQLRAVFDNQPQLPFDSVRLRFKGGPRGPLSTPPGCGTYTTQAEFYGWAGNPPAIRQSSFTIDRGPDGGPCRPSRPFGPRMTAGVESPVAGASSPFLLNLVRADGEQEMDGLAVDLPPGLLARLKGVARCPDAVLASISPLAGTGAGQFAAPSCPANSQIGTVTVGAGAGPAPFYARTGRLYLAGPYMGAPLSLAAVVPALAGPFDLGTVVVRNRVTIDRDDAQAHVLSDPLPTILFGIPLKVRDIRVAADRPGFMRSPTNCEPMSVDGAVHSSEGATARPSSHFQVGDCGSLALRPTFRFRLKGGTKRGKYPALRTVVSARPDEAGFGRVSVALPRSAFLEQAHIRTVCTRVQFAADNCPKGSIYGRARVWTPLLDEPLVGPAYLRSSSNKLPDLVLALRGPASLPIEVDLVGRIDSLRGGIRTTFDAPPDAPVSRVILDMQGGKKGLLVNSRDICKSTSRATVKVRGQNGDTFTSRPRMKRNCSKKNTTKKREAHK